MDENQIVDWMELFAFFESKISAMPESSRKSYKKALGSLRFFVESFEQPPAIGKIPGEWVVAMFAAGLSPKSRLHYFESVAALFAGAAKAGLILPVDGFSSLKPAVKAMASQPASEISIAELNKVRGLARSFFSAREERDPILGLILVSLLNGAMAPAKLALLRTENIAELEPASREIAMSLASAGRKFVFPLKQSQQTRRQLERSVAAEVAQTLAASSVGLFSSVQETLAACWALGALSCGASGAETVGALGFVPVAVPVLGLVEPAATAREKSNLMQTVGSMFMANPREWFALRLRPHIRFERFETRLGRLSAGLRPEIFYPSREISRRVNKKIITEKKPVIPEIVFFRSRVTDIAPLIREAGDLGWVYTNAGTYARIAPRAMETFQRAIGQFAPDYEVGSVGSLEYHPGDRVEILGGLGQGHSAEVLGRIKARAGVIYRLKIFGDQRDIEFRVDDTRMLQPERVNEEIIK